MKNITLRISDKKLNVNTTISIKLSLLDTYTMAMYGTNYADNKKLVNKMIRTVINPTSKELSQLASDFLLSMIKEKIEECRKKENN